MFKTLEKEFYIDGRRKKLLPKSEESLVWQSMLKIFKVLGEDEYNLLENLNKRANSGIPLRGGFDLVLWL